MVHILDFASLCLQLLLNFSFSRLALDDCVFKSLVLLIDRLDPGLVVADLGLHVAYFPPEVPRIALGPTCSGNQSIINSQTNQFQAGSNIS